MTFTSRFSRSLVVAAVAASSSLIDVAAAQLQPQAEVAATVRARQPQIQESARLQMQDLQKIKASMSPMQRKIGSRLYMGMLERKATVQRVADPRLARLTDLRFVQPEADGRVPVQVLVRKSAGVASVRHKLAALGAVTLTDKTVSYNFRVITARVRLEDLESLAALPQVRQVRQAPPTTFNSLNVSEGDVTHGADLARAYYGNDGTGVKVCVISDGVVSNEGFDTFGDAQRTGDIPSNVEILRGERGAGDEGVAMLEVIHDLAPGASLEFASTGFGDEATTIQNIHDLANAGCNIIADDVTFGDESPFEDGPVAQAVNDVTAAGVLYFSAAGNTGNAADLTSGTWEGDFKESTLTPPERLFDNRLNDFGDGGNSILVESVRPEIPENPTSGVVLTWAEHYDLDDGRASTDFDLYVMDAALTRIVDYSEEYQDGTEGSFPFESVATFAGDRVLINKYADGLTSSAPMMHLEVLRGVLDHNLATNGATRGHSAAADAFSVAATPAAGAVKPGDPVGPFPGVFTSANVSEKLSSDGPRRILLDGATGAELTPGNRTSTGGVVRQKPDFTAADGVVTRTPGSNPFFGTSASAAHAAGIAALIEAAVPGITPAQVRTALTSTAIDIEAPGVDDTTGAGIIMAKEAIGAAGGSPVAGLAPGKPVFYQVHGDGDAFIEPNEEWRMSVPLRNIGGAGATSISTVLTTTTPGVTIVSTKSDYPDLPPSGSGRNARKFDFIVSPTFPCATPIAFALTTSYNGGVTSPQTFPIVANTGAIGTPVTTSYSGPAVPIPDAINMGGTTPGAVAAVDLPVALDGNVGDVNFSIDGTACSADYQSTTVGLDHTWVGDLVVKLVSPSGTPGTLISRTGGPGSNFCQTVLDDEGGGRSIQLAEKVNEPFTGNFLPANPLSTFRGEPAAGTWQMQVQDFAAEDTGSIRAVSIDVTPGICNAPPLPGPGISVADLSLAEGTSGTTNRKKFNFIVKLDRPSATDVTVDYVTVAGTAGPGDFASRSGTLTIPAGKRSAQVRVPITPDRLVEGNETMQLHLSNPTGAAILDDTAVGTIVDDD